MGTISKEFKVAIKSLNTNSFGLYRMVVIAKDGEAYATHASMYNVKEEGEIVNQSITTDNKTGEITSRMFVGHELTERLSPDAPKNVINEIWN